MEKDELFDKKSQVKPTAQNYILLSIPVIGVFYAMFRMLFVVNKQFNQEKSFYGKGFWKLWFNCIFVMLAAAISCIPFYVVFYFISKLEIAVLTVLFVLLIFISLGFAMYFFTNYVVNKSRHTNNEQE